MQEDEKKQSHEYPEEFDSKQFLKFVRERFGATVMPEEELLVRFTEFMSPGPENAKGVNEEDVISWYQEVINEVQSAQKPLDVTTGSDLSNPHGIRKPSLERRIADQDMEVSLASSLLQEQHSPRKVQEKKPRPPLMGDEV